MEHFLLPLSSPIMRKYNQNKIKNSASGRIEDYILEQAMLTSGGAGPESAVTGKMLQGFLLPPPPPPGGHNNTHHHSQQEHLLSSHQDADHAAAVALTADRGTGQTTRKNTTSSVSQK